MNPFRRAGGAAVPPGWHPERALSEAQQRLRAAAEIKRAARSRVIVAEGLIDGPDWPAREQGHRATCNAFAAIAAEEAQGFLKTGKLTRLSEEYLYRATRAQPLPEKDNPWTEAEKQEIEDSGATFLSQVRVAMAEVGLHLDHGPPYDTHPKLPANHVIGTPRDPGKVTLIDDEYGHDIAKSKDFDHKVEFVTGLPDSESSLTGLFLKQLERERPVVASFPLFETVGMDAFTGPNAQLRGLVGFPDPALATRYGAVSGHTVCLLGFVSGGSPNVLDGQFLCRNSYGRSRFNSLADRDETGRAPKWPGYGYIPAADVEVFCWEYLYRA